jgi:hypothetical protein
MTCLPFCCIWPVRSAKNSTVDWFVVREKHRSLAENKRLKAKANSHLNISDLMDDCWTPALAGIDQGLV